MKRSLLFLIATLLMLTAAVPVSGQQKTVGAQFDTAATIDEVNEAVTVPIPNGQGYTTIGISASGTWVGTIEVQCAAGSSSAANDAYVALILAPRNSSTTVTSFTANGQWSASITGCQRVRALASAWTSGSARVTLVTSANGGGSGGGGGGSGNNAAGATGSAVPSSADYQGVNVAGTLRGQTGIAAGSHFPATVAIVDAAGNQITAFSGSGGTSSNFGAAFPSAGTAMGYSDGTNMVAGTILTTQADNVANTVDGIVTTGFNYIFDGSTWDRWTGAVTVSSGSITVTDGAGALNVICDSGCSGGTQYTQDAALTVATTVGTMAMGRASATAPSNVSAGDDAVLAWYLLNGAQATVLTAAGALIGGDATNGIDVDVTRVTGTVTVAGGLTHNTSAASSNRMGTLPAIVQNTAPTLTDGRDAALSLTTGGAQRVMLTDSAGTALTLAADATFGTTTYTETSTKGPIVGGIRTDTPATLGNTTNEAVPFAFSALGGVYTAIEAADPCARLAKTYVVINIASATTTQLVAASASNKLYVCSLAIGPVGAAQNIALVEDATGSCASPDAGLYGGTTTGTGMIFPVNGGITLGDGTAAVLKTASTNVNVCAVSSSSGQTSGVLSYVLAP